MKQLSILILIFLSSCCCKKEVEPASEKKSTNNAYLDLLYERGVRDAMNPTPLEIDSSLLSITAAEDTIINDTPYVKMASLVQKDWLPGYQTSLKTKKPYKIDFDGFYTIVPEIKDHFKTEEPYENTDLLVLRTKQLLGLPYQKPYSHFVELWVKLDDVKRPCPDADPTDTSCLLEFPADVDPSYREWFNSERFTSYVSKDIKSVAYPFTQLGYTYDWGNLGNEKGLSEFVVLGSKEIKYVYVDNISTISEYLSD